jgi:hypothetical protein
MAKKDKKRHVTSPSEAGQTEKAQPTETATSVTVLSAAASPWWQNALLLAVVLFVAGWLYLPALSNGFTNYDDDVYVTANRNVVWQRLHEAFSVAESISLR